mmetsp:Transcript_3332/g.10942  ORF Transcript_3332/g.10942 Transcript_3332/m.10942 type:complete len:219 (-) Transcript_3332:505-1161(-)
MVILPTTPTVLIRRQSTVRRPTSTHSLLTATGCSVKLECCQRPAQRLDGRSVRLKLCGGTRNGFAEGSLARCQIVGAAGVCRRRGRRGDGCCGSRLVQGTLERRLLVDQLLDRCLGCPARRWRSRCSDSHHAASGRGPVVGQGGLHSRSRDQVCPSLAQRPRYRLVGNVVAASCVRPCLFYPPRIVAQKGGVEGTIAYLADPHLTRRQVDNDGRRGPC